MSDGLHHGRLIASVADVIDSGFDLVPHFELAAIPMIDNHERPAEVPALRRRLRAEGIRTAEHHGVLLLVPGDLDHLSSVGIFQGTSELLLVADWNDEFESFPGRINSDAHNFNDGTPLGLEEWMMDARSLLVLGDGAGLNFATPDEGLAERLRARFKTAND